MTSAPVLIEYTTILHSSAYGLPVGRKWVTKTRNLNTGFSHYKVPLICYINIKENLKIKIAQLCNDFSECTD